jgi:4-alpha-glucanotransferase
MKKRGSGILLHISSLPSLYGIGDFGPSAYQFADILTQINQRYWQILPLSPTDTIYHNSPYYGLSAFALNPLFISPDFIIKEGRIQEKDLEPAQNFSKEKVQYQEVTSFKRKLFDKMCSYLDVAKESSDYQTFCERNRDWIDNYAFFTAINKHFNGKHWRQWPGDIRNRLPEAVSAWSNTLKREIEAEKFIQYVLEKQWFSLKEYCNKKGICIIGDIPIYVDYNSAELWGNPNIFKLDEDKNPYVVAGVPPDYFSETGQLWGNPIYNWDELKRTGFQWWIKRLKRAFSLYDIVRIDHFRGLVAYWEIPAKEKTAVNGKWVNVPVTDFFDSVLQQNRNYPIIAEDLGIITEDVAEIMKKYGFPGMKVLLFAFGGELGSNPYLPHNHVEDCILYTGTHDNNTAVGWFKEEATEEEKNNLFKYVGKRVSSKNIAWELIRIAMSSVAKTVIIPMQDILSLDQNARMNKPSVAKDNWEWRLPSLDIDESLLKRFKEYTKMYGR